MRKLSHIEVQVISGGTNDTSNPAYDARQNYFSAMMDMSPHVGPITNIALAFSGVAVVAVNFLENATIAIGCFVGSGCVTLGSYAASGVSTLYNKGYDYYYG